MVRFKYYQNLLFFKIEASCTKNQLTNYYKTFNSFLGSSQCTDYHSKPVYFQS